MIDTSKLLHFTLLYLIIFNNKNDNNDNNNIQCMRYKVFFGIRPSSSEMQFSSLVSN